MIDANEVVKATCERYQAAVNANDSLCGLMSNGSTESRTSM